MRVSLQATPLARDWQMVGTRPDATSTATAGGVVARSGKNRRGETHHISKNGTDVQDSDPSNQEKLGERTGYG